MRKWWMKFRQRDTARPPPSVAQHTAELLTWEFTRRLHEAEARGAPTEALKDLRDLVAMQSAASDDPH